MAEARIERALDIIENTANSGGYLTKASKVDVLEAVSDIRDSLVELKLLSEAKTREMENTMNASKEVKCVQTDDDLQREGRSERQLATSVGPTDKHQQPAAPDGQTGKETPATTA